MTSGKGVYKTQAYTHRLSRESRWTRVTSLSLKRRHTHTHTRDTGGELKQYGGGEKTQKSSGLQWRQRLRHTHRGTCRSADKWSSVQSETRMLTVMARHEAMPCAWNQSTLQTFHWSCSRAVRHSGVQVGTVACRGCKCFPV